MAVSPGIGVWPWPFSSAGACRVYSAHISEPLLRGICSRRFLAFSWQRSPLRVRPRLPVKRPHSLPRSRARHAKHARLAGKARRARWVELVHLVSLVGWFVWFLSFFEPNQLNKQDKPNKQDRPNEQDKLADHAIKLKKSLCEKS